MAEEDASTKKGGLSFGFAKKKDNKKLQKSIASDVVQTKEDEPDFVYSLEGKEVKSSKPKDSGPKVLVIPLIKENNWRTPYLEKLSAVEEEKRTTTNKADELKKDAKDELSEQAAKEILEATALQNQTWEERGKPDPNLSVPLLVRNKVPEGFETDDKLDVALRPDEPADANYEEIPIEQFGFAMLRGMGWKDGEGIGKNKQVVAPLEATLRPKGLGLGADRSSQQKNGTMPNENARNGDDESLALKKGAFCLIVKGSNKDLYGIVEGIDTENARVMVKLTLSGKTVTISQYAVDVVSKRDYEKFSKYLNKGKVDKFKEEQEKNVKKKHRSRSRERSRSPHDKDRKKSHRHRSRSPYDKRTSHEHSRSPHERHHKSDKRDRDYERDRKRKHKSDQRYSDEEYSSSFSEGKNGPLNKKVKKGKELDTKDITDTHMDIMWVRPDIRVRIVDKKFKNGKYYKSKVIIVDVVSKNNCICRTDEGRVLEGLSQSVLETVIPKNDHAHALIVTGKYRGQIGEVVKRSKEKCEALLQLLSDRDTVLKLGYDDICEYVGNIDHEFNY